MELGKRKPKTGRGKRFLKEREAHLIENVKSCMFLKASSSKQLNAAMLDLSVLKKPHAKTLTKKNDIKPFEDASELERLAKASDTSLFVFAHHSKKRPHSLVFGRTYDFQILDMLEFQIDPDTFRSMESLSGERSAILRVGAKPMFAFIGDAFDTSPNLQAFRSMLLEMYRGEVLAKINLIALDSLFVVTAGVNESTMKERVFVRHYAVMKKKSGTRVPRVELEEVGPRMDLAFNRASYASKEVRSESMRVPKALRPTKTKNVEQGQLGATLGRVHMQRQQLSELALAKLKGLGKRVNPNAKRKVRENEEGAAPAAAAAADPAALAPQRDSSAPQSSKRARKLTSTYLSSVTSE